MNVGLIAAGLSPFNPEVVAMFDGYRLPGDPPYRGNRRENRPRRCRAVKQLPRLPLFMRRIEIVNHARPQLIVAGQMSSYWFGVLPFVLIITWAGLAPAEELGSLPPELVRGEDPHETYDLNALGLVHGRLTKAVLFGIPLTTTETWRPVRGKYRYALSRADFFERVGRTDFASKQRSTDTWSDVLFYGGVLIAVSGIAYPLFLGDAEEVFQTKNLVISGSLLLGGLVMSNVGTAISGPVTDVATATSFARQYNRALARRVQARNGATVRLALGTGAGAVFSISF